MAHLFVAAGLPSRAVPYALRAMETAGALGAYRDGLGMIEAVRDHAGPDGAAASARPSGRPAQRARRPECGRGVPGGGRGDHRHRSPAGASAARASGCLRRRPARSAREALAGLEVEGDAADGPILLARGNLAYFSGDLDTAWEIANQGRAFLNSPDDPWQFIDLISLQGLVLHNRG